MKVRKNLEGVFVAAAVIATFASYATAQIPQTRAASQPQVVVAMADASIPTVVVTAKRLTAAEKAALN